MNNLIIVGASGHGKVCAEIATLSGRYEDILFLDDNPVIQKCGKYDVVGTSSIFYQYINDNIEFFVSIGNFEHRKRIQEKIKNAGGLITTLIHPKATISEDVLIGDGTVVMAGTVINPGTKIGKGVIINTSSSVDHDCSIGAYSHVSVGVHLSGTVCVGGYSWIGAGAVISNNVNICSDVVIGAGAVVIKDIKESGTYIGVPAKKMKRNSVEIMNNRLPNWFGGGVLPK